tara:strand:- start:74 stop:397 length:324 start_codon:yes stop_codon:yes gene_type:complete
MTEYEHMTFIGGTEGEIAEFMGCAVGVISGAGLSDRLCYDYDKCVQVFVERDGMSLEDAEEYFQFNVLGAYVGDRTPVFLWNRELEKSAMSKEKEDAERPGTSTDRS